MALDETLPPTAPAPGSTASSRRYVPVAIAAALGVCGIFVARGFTREPPAPDGLPAGVTVNNDAITLAEGAPQWKSVRLAQAENASARWTEPVPARVTIDERRAAKVGAPLAGRVVTVDVELGQAVKAGQALFSVASADVASLRADLAKAKVELDAAKNNAARVSAMVEAKALAEKEGIAAQDALKEAQVAFDLAEQKLAALHVDGHAANEFTVTAPRSGVVVLKNVLPSQTVSADAGEPLVEIADLDSVWVVADVFEADADGIDVGTVAKVTTPSVPDSTFDATVEMVSSVVDPERHAVPVRLKLTNEGHPLKPNVYALVRFRIPPALGVTEVDASSLVSDGATQYVYVRGEDGAFRRREVVAGPVRGGKVAILQGLKTGETVVAEGALLLDNQIALAK
ncbi:MAG TPA: efflux RND transporter periplasmic adaptor subunit [bacterium]|nr:efflux RND transporter periplasmic adaptor subunit [bacterium]